VLFRLSFAFDDVVAAISDKMIRRHPHVFAAAGGIETAADQTKAWEHQKAAERAADGKETDRSALAGLPVGLPALTRAVKLTKRAARVGFDWREAAPILDKLNEEAEELREALESGDRARIEDEFGDALFVLANFARHADIDPESALRSTNAKFERRFRYIEQRLEEQGRKAEDVSLEAMDALWDEAKAMEKKKPA
jgi:ATP diphosphatase